MSALPKRGEIWWCELPGAGRRPAVVLTRDPAIPRMRRVTVAPCTGSIRGLVSEVALDPDEDPVPCECVVNLDSVQNVPVESLVRRLGRLSGVRMHAVCVALSKAVDCRG